MKKISVTFLLFIVLAPIKAQIPIINPLPRVGDEVEINFDLKRDSSSHVINENGYITFKKVMLDTGKICIGPFVFFAGGKKYYTDSSVILVDQPLPLEGEGIWIRQGTYAGRNYLIVEQRIPGEWKKKKVNGTFSTTFESLYEYADLNVASIGGISLEFAGSREGSTSMYMNGYSGSVMIMHKQSTYIITSKDITTPVIISKDSFEHFPKKLKFSPFTIR